MSSSPYAPAAKLLNQIWTQRKGLKTVAYNRQGELICSKSTYAQCAHVLQNKPVLDRLLETKSVKDAMKLQAKNEGLLYVLLYELLMGPNRSIRGGGSLKRQLMAQETMLRQALQDLIGKEGETDSPKSLDVNSRITIPRYVRVNTLKTTTSKVIKRLEAKGLDKIFLDPHVPDVLVLPPTPETRALLQDMVTSHEVVLQDKSSCFSALCLVHGFDDNQRDEQRSNSSDAVGVYLDACAAPGNKTSHLAALLAAAASKQSLGQTQPRSVIIHALDKSKDRYQLLRRRMKDLVGESNGDKDSSVLLQCHNLDFFEALSTDKKAPSSSPSNIFQNVQAILLDPSCSGSGMTSNHLEAANEHRGDPTFCNDRVKSLAEFQLKALQHATSSEAFPNVTRVVYSTCSLYTEENERVVQRFLESQTKGSEKSSSTWTLVAPKCLSTWKRRGIALDGLSPEKANALIRVHPEYDASNGFFVACFEKRSKPASPVKKSKKGKKSVSSVIKTSLAVPGIPLYNNEFHNADEPKQRESITETPQPKAKAAAAAAPPKRKVESTVPAPTGSESNKKQKVQKVRPVLPEKGAVVPDGDSKISKKRAKKLEWKRKQHERKVERLAQNDAK